MVNMRMVETEMIQGIQILSHGIGATVSHDQTEEIENSRLGSPISRSTVVSWSSTIMEAALLRNGIAVSRGQSNS